MSKEQAFHKVTLGTGKEVLLREIRISHQEVAIKAVGDKAGDNKILASTMIQKELMKILIAKINGKEITHNDLEKLDDHFTFQEYGQLLMVLDKISGGDEMGKFQTEIVVFGSK